MSTDHTADLRPIQAQRYAAMIEFALFLLPFLQVFYAPFTKVEESFYIHATHDILAHGWDITKYDHLTYPGVVPRSFIPALLTSALAYPVIRILALLEVVQTKFQIQLVVRCILAFLNVAALVYFKRTVSRIFTRRVSVLWTVLIMTSFHIPFYISRTLPNFYAFPVALVAITKCLAVAFNPMENGKLSVGRSALWPLQVFIALGIIVRSELSLLAPIYFLQLVAQGKVDNFASFSRVFKMCCITTAAAIAATVSIDTYFWQKNHLMWPELAAIHFNIVQGKSAEWGTSPFMYYFSHHLPKLLMSSGPFAVMAFLFSAEARRAMLPYVLYTSGISFIRHKEWRFIVYVVPVITIGAAMSLSRVWSSRNKALLSLARKLLVIGVVAFNVVVTSVLFKISSLNYPGGQALSQLHSMLDASSPVHVHIDAYSAMTGVTLFGHLHDSSLDRYLPLKGSISSWSYSKAENLESVEDYRQYSHLITANTSPFVADGMFKIIYAQSGFSGIDRSSLKDSESLSRNLMKGVVPSIIVQKELVWILQRSDWEP